MADAELCHQLTRSLAELKVPLRGIDLIRQAIRKIQLFDSQLTSIHADMCQLCLLAKCFKPALVFLNTDITSISQEVLNMMILTYDLFFLVVIAIVNDNCWLDGCYFCYTDLRVCCALVTDTRKLKGKALGNILCHKV